MITYKMRQEAIEICAMMASSNDENYPSASAWDMTHCEGRPEAHMLAWLAHSAVRDVLAGAVPIGREIWAEAECLLRRGWDDTWRTFRTTMTIKTLTQLFAEIYPKDNINVQAETPFLSFFQVKKEETPPEIIDVMPDLTCDPSELVALTDYIPDARTRFKKVIGYHGGNEWRCEVDVRLRRTNDGLEVDCVDTIGYPADDDQDVSGPRFMWSEGNYACDCNRHLFFERALGNDPNVEDGVCTNDRYEVVAPQWLVDAIDRASQARERFQTMYPPTQATFVVTEVDQENGTVTLGTITEKDAETDEALTNGFHVIDVGES